MRFWSKAALLTILVFVSVSDSIQAQESRTLRLDVYPPGAEVRAFFPDSPASGDLLPNGQDFPVPGKFVALKVRLTCPGYELKEDEIKLLRIQAIRPGHWEYKTRLRPDSVGAFLADALHFHPVLVWGSLGSLLLLLGGGVYAIRRKVSRATEEATAAQVEAAQEVEDLRKRLREGAVQLEGEVLDGYTILEELGEGTYSTVYKAENNDGGELVALKMLKHGVESDEILARMRREIAIGRDLQHPNIVKLFGFGMLGKAPYIVTEFVPGQPLDDVLKEGWMEIPRVLDIIEQVFVGIDYAHKKGIVHRDLKPANLFLTDDDTVKILDFGLARMLESEQQITKTGEAMGTPLYMSPEQVRGISRPASDYYAAGVILYEMLGGRVPFTGSNAMEILSAHAFKKAPPVHQVNPRIPPVFSELVDALMVKHHDERLCDLEEIQNRLAQLRTTDAARRPAGQPE